MVFCLLICFKEMLPRIYFKIKQNNKNKKNTSQAGDTSGTQRPTTLLGTQTILLHAASSSSNTLMSLSETPSKSLTKKSIKSNLIQKTLLMLCQYLAHKLICTTVTEFLKFQWRIQKNLKFWSTENSGAEASTCHMKVDKEWDMEVFCTYSLAIHPNFSYYYLLNL